MAISIMRREYYTTRANLLMRLDAKSCIVRLCIVEMMQLKLDINPLVDGRKGVKLKLNLKFHLFDHDKCYRILRIDTEVKDEIHLFQHLMGKQIILPR